jgi:vancomycin resistance protein VanW
LISGKLKEDYGGGLCQLSSIIYHLSLIAGMDIWERHNHSVDIYKERDRFTPLGSDATVVYGYKDLRIRNNLGTPVKISLSIIDNNLKCVFSSSQPLKRHKIVFHRIDIGDSVEVETFDCSDHE